AARESYGRLVAHLAREARDLAAAEDALADAFALALENWPRDGTPANPQGWLATVARNRLRDAARRRATASRSLETLTMFERDLRSAVRATGVADRRLELMFACAHPAIDPAMRAPLMLQVVLGLDAAAIGAAYLVAPATMGQRLSRAKAKIRDAGVPFRVPEPEERRERMSFALEAIYAAFSNAWGEAFADDPRGRDLSTEAIWLARVAAALAPGEPETLGCLALLLYVDARRPARRDPVGSYVPLSGQDVSLWNGAAIDEAERLLSAASIMGRPDRFQIEAAIQSAHCARRRTGATDWPAISLLYARLYEITRSPVVAVNRAVAVAEVEGAAAGLALLAEVEGEGGLLDFQPLWAAKAELSARAHATEAALEAYGRAIGLERDPAARAFLIERRARLAH
ncbi:MAG: RNA polymerase subunit sigma-70, partial [Hyphomicrobiales bacterium]|nr:RNA polymerase subunit sigma-70 [Hyphomicrobiales bacterium]